MKTALEVLREYYKLDTTGRHLTNISEAYHIREAAEMFGGHLYSEESALAAMEEYVSQLPDNHYNVEIKKGKELKIGDMFWLGTNWQTIKEEDNRLKETLELQNLVSQSNAKIIHDYTIKKEKFIKEMLKEHLTRWDKFLVRIFGLKMLKLKVWNLQQCGDITKVGVRIYGKEYWTIIDIDKI